MNRDQLRLKSSFICKRALKYIEGSFSTNKNQAEPILKTTGALITISFVLTQELEKRQKRNSNYSLRAFARDLKLSHTSLSQIIKGKRGLSRSKAKLIAKHLGFTEDETLYFVDLSLCEFGRSKKERQESANRLFDYDTRFNTIDLKLFHMIASWQALSIIELIRMFQEQATPQFTAKKLGISNTEATYFFKILTDLGLLSNNKITKERIGLGNVADDKIVKELHKNLLQKAEQAVLNQPAHTRVFGSTILRAREEDLDWIASEMKRFRRRLSKRIEEGEGHDHVYCLSTQFFKLDN